MKDDPHPPPPLEQYISLPDAAKRLAVTERTLRNWGVSGRNGFPRSVKLGGQRTFFVERELAEWARAQKETRRDGGKA